MSEYLEFLDRKAQISNNQGFEPIWMPDKLFDFQKSLSEWGIITGRSAFFADCGLGKSPMQLTWAENVVRHTNGNILILTPLAVSAQTVREAEKFGIEAKRSKDGSIPAKITVTNYESLHAFDSSKFAGCVCDESSILKSFDGKRKAEITEFMRKMKYRLLATATASPNDYIELGTSSEALGKLGYMDMLNRFFKNDLNNSATGRKHGNVQKWRFKGHAELPFWRWVCSWARAIRKPSDLGFEDGNFILPKLSEVEHLVSAESIPDGMLFSLPAVGLKEQREERRRTIKERCEMAAQLTENHSESVIWCHLNDEGDLLEEITEDSKQVCGANSDDEKEEIFNAFSTGQLKRLITKSKIGGWGLNWQHCAHSVSFPSHSFELYYQSIRRFYRFGQIREVTSDIVTTQGEQSVLKNLKRKSAQADEMFSNLIAEMNRAIAIDRNSQFTKKPEIPSWLTQ